MYAIFKLSGFQYRGEEGNVISVPSQNASSGSKLDINEVLLIHDGQSATIGAPFVTGARIEAEIVKSGKGEKILMYKYKRRTKYKRTQGHRQGFTEIRISRIVKP
ncbi:MAG: 50S ribosomal protein L21 [candidate division Zixibacteria bacterium]|nr:50S ribosomal protein L21 [candidate division Zixibacteria bacterium]